MSRTITALFDTRADAEAGRARLVAAHVDADNVRILDQQSAPAGATNAYSTADEPGIWSSIKNAFLPDEDRAAYEEGIRRGGFVLTADVDEDEIDRAVDALEDANSVDIDERSNAWRAEGWTAPAVAPRGALFGDDAGRTINDQKSGVSDVGEQLVAGKRESERGSARMRSYVTEMPMHEQVRQRQDRNERGTAAAGSTLAGLGNEAIGNVKQGLGSLTGNDSLKQAGKAQEQRGEGQQGKTPGY